MKPVTILAVAFCTFFVTILVLSAKWVNAERRLRYVEGQMSVYKSYASDNYNTDVYTSEPKGADKW